MTNKVKAFGDRILALMVDRPIGFKKSKSGLLIVDKDMDQNSIRPRWFKIYDVGEEIDWVKPDQYVLVAHGRWSNGIKAFEGSDDKLYLLDNKELLMVSDEKPEGVEFEEEVA